jgi:hypothetical protein
VGRDPTYFGAVEAARRMLIFHKVALFKQRSRRMDDISALLDKTGVIFLVVCVDVV